MKDLNILNRNSIEDATHYNSMYHYVQLTGGWYYFEKGATNKWLKSYGGKPEYYAKLTKIDKYV